MIILATAARAPPTCEVVAQAGSVAWNSLRSYTSPIYHIIDAATERPPRQLIGLGVRNHFKDMFKWQHPARHVSQPHVSAFPSPPRRDLRGRWHPYASSRASTRLSSPTSLGFLGVRTLGSLLLETASVPQSGARQSQTKHLSCPCLGSNSWDIVCSSARMEWQHLHASSL